MQLTSHFFFKNFDRFYYPLPSPNLSSFLPLLTTNFPKHPPRKQYFPCLLPLPVWGSVYLLGFQGIWYFPLLSASPGYSLVIWALSSSYLLLNFFKAGVVSNSFSFPFNTKPRANIYGIECVTDSESHSNEIFWNFLKWYIQDRRYWLKKDFFFFFFQSHSFSSFYSHSVTLAHFPPKNENWVGDRGRWGLSQLEEG